MSKLLINEPPLQVLPSLAAAIGLNEAIFLQQLHYWIKRSGKPRDGRLWVHNTYDEWAAQFPFWSVPTIRRIVRSLRDQGLLQTTDRYNQSRIDRTPWYAINYEALDAIDAPPISRSADFDSRSDQIDQTSDEISSPPDQFDQTIRSERSDEPINVITSIYRTETTTETTERERERERGGADAARTHTALPRCAAGV